MDVYQAFFEYSADLLFIVEYNPVRAPHFIYAGGNPALYDATGLTPVAFIGRSPEDLFPSDQAEKLLAEYKRCMQNMQPISFEHMVNVPSGMRSWHVQISPCQCDDGTMRIFGAGRDITWSQNFAQQLETVSAAIPGFVYQLRWNEDTQWQYSFVGARVEEMFGVSAEEAMRDAATLMDLIHPDDCERVCDERMNCANSGKPWHGEFRMFHRDGHTLWIEAHEMPQQLDHGTLLWTGYVNDVTERHDMQERIRHLAQHDPLTDLPNRTMFFAHLEHALHVARRHEQSMALLFIDLDEFKPVNDFFGHAAGDELLVQTAARLKEHLRESDVVGRLGGDEFVVMLNGPITEDETMEVATSLCRALTRPFIIRRRPITVSASIGAALYPHHGQDCDTLTQAADRAMYTAKGRGRRQVVLAGDN